MVAVSEATLLQRRKTTSKPPVGQATLSGSSAAHVRRYARLDGTDTGSEASRVDIETCPACGGALRIIACIEDPAVINKILTYIESKNASAEPARSPPCRAPPQLGVF